jgi:hypothetical protein
VFRDYLQQFERGYRCILVIYIVMTVVNGDKWAVKIPPGGGLRLGFDLWDKKNRKYTPSRVGLDIYGSYNSERLNTHGS